MLTNLRGKLHVFKRSQILHQVVKLEHKPNHVPAIIRQFFAIIGFNMRAIDNAADYMAASMDLLEPQVMQELFLGERHISTKIQDAPPVKYFPGCQVHNSIIATGCMIRGTVENSIIFRSCTVEEGAVVRNSIIMPNDVISKGAQLENVICDKFVTIGEGVRLYGSALRPLIVPKKQYS